MLYGPTDGLSILFLKFLHFVFDFVKRKNLSRMGIELPILIDMKYLKKVDHKFHTDVASHIKDAFMRVGRIGFQIL